MKRLAFLIIGMFALMQVWAQPDSPCETCLPEGIAFNAQSQIDSFQINYPNCREILGNVSVVGYWSGAPTNITNLHGLRIVNKIAGSVSIYRCDSLASLAGLEYLTTIGSNLNLSQNSSLKSLSGLDRLNSISGGLTVEMNDSMGSLTGCMNLTNIGGHLAISDNPSLLSLSGLDTLNSIGDYMLIEDNDLLESLAGLHDLSSIGDDLIVKENISLINLAGLENLKTIGDEILIQNNDALSSLVGLDSIEANTITGLDISYNETLSNCVARGICYYLADPGGYVHIAGNAQGCNSLTEVREQCEEFIYSIDEYHSWSNIILFPNPVENILNIQTNGETMTKLRILNLSGQIIVEQWPAGNQIDVSGLCEGLYIIECLLDGRWYRQKLMVQDK